MTSAALPTTSPHSAPRPRAMASSRSLRRGVITATAFFLVALSWSPLLPGLFGIPFSVALFAAFLPLAALTAAERGVNPRVAVFCVLMLCICLLMLLLSQSTILLLRIAPLPLLIFVAWQTQALPGLPQRLCHLLTVFLAIGVAGALIGVIYALAGGEPILSIANIDGRENGLYLATMSNYNFLGLIRPSFIYDEAGAFSFMLCATVALREALGRSRRASYLLMIGGLVTFSLTHFLITLIYLTFRNGFLKTVTVTVALLIPLVPLAVQNEQLGFLVSRFAIEDGEFAGDNRSEQLKNFLAVVHPAMVLFGAIECQARAERMCEEHGDITSSPVTPTYNCGIVALVVQLCMHTGLIVAFFRSKRFRFSALTLSLLLLQRPYLEISGYGFICFFLLFLMLQQRIRKHVPA